jgi:hypothetical protein
MNELKVSLVSSRRLSCESESVPEGSVAANMNCTTTPNTNNARAREDIRTATRVAITIPPNHQQSCKSNAHAPTALTAHALPVDGGSCVARRNFNQNILPKSGNNIALLKHFEFLERSFSVAAGLVCVRAVFQCLDSSWLELLRRKKQSSKENHHIGIKSAAAFFCLRFHINARFHTTP